VPEPNDRLSRELTRARKTLDYEDKNLDNADEALQNFLQNNALPSSQDALAQGNYLVTKTRLELGVAEAKQKVAEAKRDVAEAEWKVAEAKRDVAEAARDDARTQGSSHLAAKELEVTEADQKVAKAKQKVAEAKRGVTEADQKVAKAKQDVAEADQKVAKAERDVARAQGSPDLTAKELELKKADWDLAEKELEVAKSNGVSGAELEGKIKKVDVFRVAFEKLTSGQLAFPSQVLQLRSFCSVSITQILHAFMTAVDIILPCIAFTTPASERYVLS
jgi:multidrug resistance efflux pump